nr:tail fiber protein [uncultured Draconibacterium sp.]
MEGYTGEIRMFAGNFAPRGWALCQGQYLEIAECQALYSILGTAYGGDGRTVFALPNICGRLPVGAGQGVNLTERFIGQMAGTENETLTLSNLPSHNHNLQASGTEGSVQVPEKSVHAISYGQIKQGGSTYTGQNINYTLNDSKVVNMNSKSLKDAGNNAEHSNMQPYLGINYIICLDQQYPTRN